MVRLSLTTVDPEGDCKERLSDSFIERTYGTRSRCEQVQREDDDGADVESVDFASVEVDGDRATTEIETSGGELGRVSGALDLVKEGEDWRIDDVAVPLLRNLTEEGVRSTEDIPPEGVDCVLNEIGELTDADFRDFAYGLIGQRPEASRQIYELLAGCEGQGGVSVLQQVFDEGIAESLRESGASQEAIDCALARVRERLTNDQLVDLLSSPNPNEAAERALGPAVSACL